MEMTEAKRREYFNLPNYLTLGRVLLIPIVMLILMKISPLKSNTYNLWFGIMASLVFLVAAISDLVDGYYARKFKINSVFGKYFDPLADKLMILAAMIMLIPLGRISAWIVVVFLAREFTITALRGIATAEGFVIAADQWGKKKTFLQNIALFCLMIYYPILGIKTYVLGTWVLWLALIVAIASGINYIVKFSNTILGKS